MRSLLVVLSCCAGLGINMLAQAADSAPTVAGEPDIPPVTTEYTPPEQPAAATPAPANTAAPDAAAAAKSSSIIEVELPSEFSASAQPVLPVKPVPKDETPKREPSGAEGLPYEIEVGATYATLNNGYVDWSGTYLNAEMKLADHNNIYCEIRQTNRFSQADKEVMAGFYDPINDQVTVIVEASASNAHRVLPGRSLSTLVEYEINKSWDASVGLRHYDYGFADLNLLTLGAEYYWDKYRVSYTRNQGYMLGNGMANNNLFQFSIFYGDMNWAGVTASAGRELEALVTDRVTSSRVLSLAVGGRHQLKPNLALTYAAGNYHQGTFYVRNGVQLGLRRQF